MRGGGAEQLRWSGKLAMPRGASPKWVGAPGLVEEERGWLVRSGDGESVTKTGVEAGHPYQWTVKPEAGTKCTGGSSLIVVSTGTDGAARGGG
jgi:hypothetical protein